MNCLKTKIDFANKINCSGDTLKCFVRFFVIIFSRIKTIFFLNITKNKKKIDAHKLFNSYTMIYMHIIKHNKIAL